MSNEPNLQVRLAIQDTGQGIAPEDLPYVFEPYFRATNGAQAYHEGKGLGLAIAAKLLALHESELTVSSELGKGARFEFLLPAS
ncbi:hypothetical protein DKW60_22835 [Leucothrix pacifica]|uniref:histidine kinase n=1 Tax=Leucothrix pacifica TaxID=1247513 RepID=A0A317C0D7_9GAMM|nr:hypothetical protein DKW60_22835 [Leucothrix pacifica]